MNSKTEKKPPKVRQWVRPCEKTGPKNQWFKPVISENKSLVRKKLITGLEKLTSDFWDLSFSQSFYYMKITSGF